MKPSVAEDWKMQLVEMLIGHRFSYLSRVKHHHLKGHLLLFMAYCVFPEAKNIPTDGKCAYTIKYPKGLNQNVPFLLKYMPQFIYF